MVVRCDKYPQLVVNDLKVKFKDGAAEVKNKKTLAKLLAMKGYDFEVDEKFADDSEGTEDNENDGSDGGDGENAGSDDDSEGTEGNENDA